jgi:hypothetical protein
MFLILIIKLISGLLSNCRHIVHAGYTKKFIELWTNQKQTRDSALGQSKGTKTIYINSIRIISHCLSQ